MEQTNYIFSLEGKNGIITLLENEVVMQTLKGEEIRRVPYTDIYGVVFYPISVSDAGCIKVRAAKGSFRFYVNPFSTTEKPGCMRDYNFRQAYAFLQECRYKVLAKKISPFIGGSVADEIEKLAALKNSGALTEEEFAAAKKKLLF